MSRPFDKLGERKISLGERRLSRRERRVGARGCTMIGSSTGVGVTVESAMASGLDRLELRICPGPSTSKGCKTSTIRLHLGSDSVDQVCYGSDPDSACSATVAPNGWLVGFVDVAWLAAGQITVLATTTRNGQRRAFPTVSLTAEPGYPNGRQVSRPT